MSNKIELITKYSEDAFDETYRAESRIALLDGNMKGMTFVGAKTVKIPKWTGGGMFDYQRANTPASGDFSHGTGLGNGYGYQRSDMGYEWETFELAIDRAVQYNVDMFDDEETAKTLVARGTTQVNKQVVIPEMDAYGFAKIASAATLGNHESSDTIGDGEGEVAPIAALNKGLLWLEENEVDAVDSNQIIFSSPRFIQALRNTAKNGLIKPLLQGEFSKDVKFTIEEYEGRQIVSVPPKRFMTNIVLGPGFYRAGTASDAGWTRGSGSHAYVVSGASAAIDFLIVDKSAVAFIKKYNKIKVFGPDVVQDYDGYKINAHVYYDVFVPDNKRVAIYLKTGGFASAVAASTQLIYSANSTTNVLNGFAVLPGSTFTDGKFYVHSSAVKVGDDMSASLTGDAKAIGSALGDNTTVYPYVVNGKGIVVAIGASFVCADIA